jgi:hypothetical protein
MSEQQLEHALAHALAVVAEINAERTRRTLRVTSPPLGFGMSTGPTGVKE